MKPRQTSDTKYIDGMVVRGHKVTIAVQMWVVECKRKVFRRSEIVNRLYDNNHNELNWEDCGHIVDSVCAVCIRTLD